MEEVPWEGRRWNVRKSYRVSATRPGGKIASEVGLRIRALEHYRVNLSVPWEGGEKCTHDGFLHLGRPAQSRRPVERRPFGESSGRLRQLRTSKAKKLPKSTSDDHSLCPLTSKHVRDSAFRGYRLLGAQMRKAQSREDCLERGKCHVESGCDLEWHRVLGLPQYTPLQCSFL